MNELKIRVERIKLVVMDIDGVLTDGRIVYGDYGDEIKFFDVQDGLGISLLHQAGIQTAMVSSRKSRINGRRAKELKVGKLYQGVSDKSKAYAKLVRQFRVEPENICVIGDDWVDARIMKVSGLAIAVANAVDEIKAIAHHVTKRSGGHGAVREAAEMILKGQNKWDSLTERYFPR